MQKRLRRPRNKMNKKNKDLVNLEIESLNKKEQEVKKELMKLNAQIATGTSVKNPRQVRNLKKTIARIKTILNARKRVKKHNG